MCLGNFSNDFTVAGIKTFDEMDNYMILLSKKSQANMHNSVTIQKMVKQNQQNIIKIIKKGHKSKCKRVTEIVLV